MRLALQKVLVGEVSNAIGRFSIAVNLQASPAQKLDEVIIGCGVGE